MVYCLALSITEYLQFVHCLTPSFRRIFIDTLHMDVHSCMHDCITIVHLFMHFSTLPVSHASTSHDNAFLSIILPFSGLPASLFFLPLICMRIRSLSRVAHHCSSMASLQMHGQCNRARSSISTFFQKQ